MHVNASISPQVPQMNSVAHFDVEYLGGSSIQFQCKAQSTPFEVVLSSQSLNYGEVRLGKTVSRMFTIHNNSELPTKFEFFNQPGNVFSFSKTKGQIPPLSNIRILVYFSPLHTVSYYERTFCVVKNH